jgi:hypothetical protein
MYNIYLTTCTGLSNIEMEICEFGRNIEFTGEKVKIQAAIF